jgi:hypothetical protein
MRNRRTELRAPALREQLITQYQPFALLKLHAEHGLP